MLGTQLLVPLLLLLLLLALLLLLCTVTPVLDDWQAGRRQATRTATGRVVHCILLVAFHIIATHWRQRSLLQGVRGAVSQGGERA